MFIAGLAHATPGASGFYLPGAVPQDGGYAGLVTTGLPAMGPSGGLVGFEAGTSLGSSFQVGIAGLADPTGATGATAMGLFDVRYQAVDEPGVRFSPHLVFGVGTPDLAMAGAVGVSAEGGGSVLRWDFSVPVVGVAYDSYYSRTAWLTVLPLSAEAGLSVIVHQHHRIRAGFPPVIGYHYLSDHFYADLGGVYLMSSGLVFAKLGARW